MFLARRIHVFGPVYRSVLCFVCLVLLGGCGGGDDGPQRFRVSGRVTFDGKPVPAGTVYFQPDAGKGNNGPAATVPIKNGQYDTKTGKGTIGGPHRISVGGFDGMTTTDKPDGNPLFVPHSIEVDLPKDDSEHDVDVPASAAEGLEVNPDPA